MKVSGQLHSQAALPPAKEPLVPIGGENYTTRSFTACVLHQILLGSINQLELDGMGM